MLNTPEIGQEVVRSKGDYVVGRKGPVVELDLEKKRARVDWNKGGGRTWVRFDVIEPTSIPYEIKTGSFDEKKHRPIWPKYMRK